MLNDEDYETDPRKWDDEAERLGITLGSPGYMQIARMYGLPPRPMGPDKKASGNCQSGKRDYCSCDLCF